ncbi:PAAR domain-containing protein [Pseudomonas alkylphenolica]|uniref:PAAR domain-containing protein n=1 Tax=Pseudomonas alkylphenolica TaxID=237609 RepID=UPI0018D8C6C7|nr:PAAR domain-containing protein [Pseudomonas alkylphenolica]MBH3428120.1 PAAR domain-containing protein [Pseudomonas alkylphenolica]
MSGKPAARKGDSTTAGDTSPIDCGSPNVLFDGLPAAREGDTTSCGSELCGNLSSTVLINGKAAVTIDSEDSSGNVVTSGSGTVLIG